jgi:hypothetical protein
MSDDFEGVLNKNAKTKGQLGFDMISYLLTLQNEPIKWTKDKEQAFKNESKEKWILEAFAVAEHNKTIEFWQKKLDTEIASHLDNFRKERDEQKRKIQEFRVWLKELVECAPIPADEAIDLIWKRFEELQKP